MVAFLEKLGELRSLQPLAPSTCRKMDALYGLDASRNGEIRCSWYQLCVKAGEWGRGRKEGGGIREELAAEIRCSWYQLCVKAW